jgi:hypothetical protein
MKTAFHTALATAALLAATPTLARERASTTAMTCKAANALVTQRGAVVLGSGGSSYDRYVRSETLCPTGLYGRAAFVPTRDNPQCYIGYYCSGMPEFFDR